MRSLQILLLILWTATVHVSSSLTKIVSTATKSNLEYLEKTRAPLQKRILSELSIFRYRGGQDTSKAVTPASTTTVLVSTSIGSTFLDKKKKLIVGRNCTVIELKETIRDKFPGGPPVQLQKLFFGSRLLQDTELVANITTAPQIPLLLDMLTGTSAYNRTMSIAEAIEAYTASMTQQAFIGDKLRATYAAEAGVNILSDNSTIDSLIYKEMFRAINESLYVTYSSDIGAALLVEAEPEIESLDTTRWRGEKKQRSPLSIAIAKEFDINTRNLKTYFYYSILLVIFAKFGTSTKDSSKYLFALIPVLWVSKLRQLRLIFKFLLNLILPVLAYFEFFMPLLPAPYRVMAEEAYKWSESESTVKGEEDLGLHKARYIPSSSLFGRRSSAFKDYPTGDELENDDEVQDLDDEDDSEYMQMDSKSEQSVEQDIVEDDNVDDDDETDN